MTKEYLITGYAGSILSDNWLIVYYNEMAFALRIDAKTILFELYGNDVKFNEKYVITKSGLHYLLHNFKVFASRDDALDYFCLERIK